MCNSTTGAKDVERQIEATFVELRADEKQRQAEVERIAHARAKAQSCNNEKRGKIWLQLLISPKFMAFEPEKRPYVQQPMRVMGSKPKNGQEDCRLLRRIAAALPAIKAINAWQSHSWRMKFGWRIRRGLKKIHQNDISPESLRPWQRRRWLLSYVQAGD